MKNYQITLSSCGNPDHGQDPDRPVYGVEAKTLEFDSIPECQVAARQYADENDLGGGNWIDANVTNMQTGKVEGYVAYNGTFKRRER